MTSCLSSPRGVNWTTTASSASFRVGCRATSSKATRGPRPLELACHFRHFRLGEADQLGGGGQLSPRCLIQLNTFPAALRPVPRLDLAWHKDLGVGRRF